MSQEEQHTPKDENSAPTDFERAHSLTSASGAYRWLQCPGSVLLISKAPPELRSAYADEGNRAHRLAETALRRVVAKKTRTEWITAEEAAAHPTEMVKHVEGFVDYVYREFLRHQPKTVLIEEQLWLSRELNMFGTADVAYGYRDGTRRVGRVIDLKYGAGKAVYVEGNPQLAYYGCALDEMYGSGKGKPFDRVEVTIYQPRIESDEGPAHTASWEHDEIADLRTVLLAGAMKALHVVNSGSALPTDFTTGGHCDWCAAKGMCPAYERDVVLKSGHAVDDLVRTAPAELLPAVLDETLAPAVTHDERVAAIVSAKKDIMAFIKALEEYAMRRLASGSPLPGLKLVETRTKRVWADEETVTKGLQELGVDPWVKKLKPITAVQKELGKGGKALLDDLVTQSRPKAVLVGEDDPRRPLDPVAAAAAFFDDESEDEADVEAK